MPAIFPEKIFAHSDRKGKRMDGRAPKTNPHTDGDGDNAEQQL
ncbi:MULTISPECIES: hypothetical protein [unclassified Burkholderia]|nr:MULTISPECIES: hypothetical protein [unclassified Burkholderia]